MCMVGNCLFFGMATGLAYLGIVTALTIDNQLTVIKNDCYERLAIGQRLNSKYIYKTFEYNTLAECQAECTKLQSGCRAFSFGIGTKGNGTCELSSDPVRETADLKPIDTASDTEYDLYIKKLGCSIVIDKIRNDKPPPANSDTNLRPTDAVSKPTTDLKPAYENTDFDDAHRPLQNGYPKPPSSSNYPAQGYLPPSSDVHHVQTLVSVASGPHSYLHPIHEILVGERPYSYGRPQGPPRPSGCCEKNKECCAPNNLPPFRPEIFNRPYDYPKPPHRPPPGDFDGAGSSYDRPNRPYPLDRPFPSYDRPYDRPDSSNDRPDSSYDRPDPPYDRPKPPYDRPDPLYDRPKPPYDRPDPSYDRPGPSYDRPKPPYDRPDPSYDRPDPSYPRPSRPPKDQDLPYDMRRWDSRPDADYDRPPKRPIDKGYDSPKRPFRPEDPFDPIPNSVYYERPLPPKYGSVIPHPDNYDKRPNTNGYPEDDRYDRPPPRGPSYDRPGYHYDRPPKPSYGDGRPEENVLPGYHYDKPPKLPSDSQSYGNDKPGGGGGYDHGKPSKPLSESSEKPIGGSYPDSTRPVGDNGYGNGPVQGKPSDPDNPNSGYNYDKPSGQKIPYGDKGSIVTTSVGPHGEQITSIITEIKGKNVNDCVNNVSMHENWNRWFENRNMTNQWGIIFSMDCDIH